MNTATSRRRFLQTSAAVCGPLILGTKSSASVKGANERFRVAVAGVNGRGGSHVSGFGKLKNVEIAYLIDPDQRAIEKRLRKIKDDTGEDFKGKIVTDVRQALDDPDIDALSVATPNHWHSLMTIWGAQAGKHVYVEKPMSHDIAEGRVAVEAQKKYGVVIQHGTQRRSSAGIAGLHEAIKAGKFGKLKISYGYCCKPRGGIGFEPAEARRTDLDWTLWKGPAVIHQYHANYVPYDWHWFWSTGNGDLNNQGTHQLDVARWAIDDDQTHPVRAMAIGGRFQWKDQGETPNTMFGVAQYPNGQYALFNVRNVNYEGYERQVENEYYFEDGGKIIRDEYFAKGNDRGEKIEVPDGKVTPGGNWESFITACRADKPEMANGNVHAAHYGCVLGHLMNNSYRLGKKVPFNAKAGQFSDHPEVGEHFLKLHELMRDGVGIPEDGAEYTVGPWLTFDPNTERHTGAQADEANTLLQDRNNPGFEIPSPSKV